MILMKKTIENIMEETLRELEGMGIKDIDAGGVARLFLSIINKQLSTYYDALDVNIAQAFVSTAKNQFLDHIGVLMDCSRYMGEDDDNYRYRITKQLQSIASANRIALRLAALSVEGVQEVSMKRWTHGTGSYSVYVISENPVTPQTILDAVQERMDDVQAFGIRGEVFRPVTIPVEMKVRLVFEKGVTDLDKQLTISKALEAVKEYTNSRNVGETFEINELKRRINELNELIDEIIIFHFKTGGRPALTVDQVCAWNERFIESDNANALQVL